MEAGTTDARQITEIIAVWRRALDYAADVLAEIAVAPDDDDARDRAVQAQRELLAILQEGQ
jgi:hypothetical protein